MAAEGVKSVIGRMINEPGFRREFSLDPEGAIAKSGYTVTQDEMRTLASLNDEDFRAVDAYRKMGNTAVCSVDVRAAAR
jgi:hypothetical protein